MTPFATGTGLMGVDISTGVCSGLSFNGISHNLLLLRFPMITTLLFLIIFKEYFENNTKQLSLHNYPIDISDPVAKLLKIYTC